uniref:RING-type domain-containing protein n=1 Tax=Globisporangium ultimum (strain ATCC 200006 / CBS 805.95 / DAOM BR144) TaxID=431595 RepID=K3X159_GLOUD
MTLCICFFTKLTQDTKELRVLPCGHLYCVNCVRSRSKLCLKDRSLLPGHCCRKKNPIDCERSAVARRVRALRAVRQGEALDGVQFGLGLRLCANGQADRVHTMSGLRHRRAQGLGLQPHEVLHWPRVLLRVRQGVEKVWLL